VPHPSLRLHLNRNAPALPLGLRPRLESRLRSQERPLSQDPPPTAHVAHARAAANGDALDPAGTEGGEGSTAITALVTLEAMAAVHGRSPRQLPATGPWGSFLLVTALNTTGITAHRSAASASAECSATAEWRGFVCLQCQSDFRNSGSKPTSCNSSYSWEFGVPIFSSSSHFF